MTLQDFRADAMRCTRCSYCKWIPFDLVRSWQFSKGCPSVDYNSFHSYSGGGRLLTMLSLMDGRSEVDDRVVDIAYKCQLCGNCDVACKVCRYDMEPLAGIREFRRTLNEQGHVPSAYPALIAKLREAGNMAGRPQEDRTKWVEGLGIRQLVAPDASPGTGGAIGKVGKAEVLFHAGCRYSFDPGLRSAVRAAAAVLHKAGVDFALDAGEGCCGGKAYDMGYRDDFKSVAEANVERWRDAGVKTIITPCATCYWAFKRLYPDLGADLEVLHTVECVDRLLKTGTFKLRRAVPVTVTYHDPCHLGRQGEPHVPWNGKEAKIFGQVVVYEPRRPRYNGAQGVYDPPRDVLRAIPGVTLVEMDRNREAAWCCGAGGSVREAYPEFGAWTAAVRLEEAAATGAQVIATACPGCEKNLGEAALAAGPAPRVLDVLELVEQAI